MYKDYIFRMKPSATGVSSPVKGGATAEMRPGGMLVQKRSSDSNQNSNPVSNIKVKVRYGSSYHEVTVNSQTSFGELKKVLAGVTGVQAQDQKIIFREKERDSKAFLDLCGVKDGSKMVVVEDELSRERRCVETRNMEKAAREISAIRVEVDKLAKQVASIELEINGGRKVVEMVLLNLIEVLMTQLIKLDAIAADGDVKLHRRMQVKRVQEYIETLDMLKKKNSGHRNYSARTFRNEPHVVNKYGKYDSGGVVTSKWETF